MFKFENLFPFKVLTLWLDAAIPAPHQLLETCLKFSNEILSRAASDSHWTSATSCVIHGNILKSFLEQCNSFSCSFSQKETEFPTELLFYKISHFNLKGNHQTHLQTLRKNATKKWHKACRTMLLGRLVQNFVDSWYLVAELWTMSHLQRRFKFREYVDPFLYSICIQHPQWKEDFLQEGA